MWDCFFSYCLQCFERAAPPTKLLIFSSSPETMAPKARVRSGRVVYDSVNNDTAASFCFLPRCLCFIVKDSKPCYNCGNLQLFVFTLFNLPPPPPQKKKKKKWNIISLKLSPCFFCQSKIMDRHIDRSAGGEKSNPICGALWIRGFSMRELTLLHHKTVVLYHFINIYLEPCCFFCLPGF